MAMATVAVAVAVAVAGTTPAGGLKPTHVVVQNQTKLPHQPPCEYLLGKRPRPVRWNQVGVGVTGRESGRRKRRIEEKKEKEE